MKVLTLILASFLIVQATTAFDCKGTLPKLDIHSCCKIPKMADQKIIAEIGANLKKMPSTKSEAILLGCTGIQTAFQKLNLVKDNDFDEPAGIAYMESHLKDMPDWHAIIPKGVSECKKFMDPHIDEIQKAMSFTKEQCNMKYFIITHCLDLFAFAHCPPDMYKDSASCSEGQNFLKECKNDLPTTTWVGFVA